MAYQKWVEYVADFETTVDENTQEQTETQVWSVATIDLSKECHPDNVRIVGSIDQYMEEAFKELRTTNRKDLFHNLKFDGSFILSWLLNNKKMTPYTYKLHEGTEGEEERFVRDMKYKQMPNNSYTYLISSKGIWYNIIIKKGGHVWIIGDSLKLLTFSVRKIGKDFNTKFQKLEMEYVGDRYPNCPITPEEEEYIKNDVLVMHEAINFMKKQGHEKSTIAACAMADYKQLYDDAAWVHFFPANELQETVHNEEETEGDWIRKSYHGGWCYVKPSIVNDIIKGGTTADVNSLYPSMMHSDSGNVFPVGKPTWWTGDIPEEAKASDRYFFVRVRTRFKLKENHLPTIQIKDNPMYNPREWLERSDIRRPEGGWATCYTLHGHLYQARLELTLTQTDWALMQEMYDLYDTEIVEGCYFTAISGLFDHYIDKWAKVKMREKGAKRALAKLMLNSLYGKFASSTDSSYQMLYLNEDGALRARMVEEYDKDPGYIPIGTAITSYARAFTIHAAQANYDTFCYADTDSVHCKCSPNEIIGCPEDPVKFNHWKYEACWDTAIFVRQKTYMEHVTHEDRKECKPFWNLKCAGMPERAKDNFIHSIEQDLTVDCEEWQKMDDTERDFYKKTRERIERGETWDITRFKVGLRVPGSLKSKRIKGGTILCPGDYVMRPRLIRTPWEEEPPADGWDL